MWRVRRSGAAGPTRQGPCRALRAVVVNDQVHLQIIGEGLLDLAQEPQEFLVPMPGLAHSARRKEPMFRHLIRRSHMATNLALDQDLLDHAFRVSGEPTKKAAVTRALQEFIARREQRQVADLFGKLDWDRGYNYNTERERQR